MDTPLPGEAVMSDSDQLKTTADDVHRPNQRRPGYCIGNPSESAPSVKLTNLQVIPRLQTNRHPTARRGHRPPRRRFSLEKQETGFRNPRREPVPIARP